METELQDLIAVAKSAQQFARAPYSQFRVGAALQSADGRIFSGCNVESSSYGLTVCAERIALFKALSEGAEPFTRLVVLTDCDPPASPCGACRQLLWDYARNVQIYLVSSSGKVQTTSVAELFPLPFGVEDL